MYRRLWFVSVLTLRGTIMDLVIAGADTTTETLAWIVLYACKYPEVQQKMQEELDNNTKRDRVELAERPL